MKDRNKSEKRVSHENGRRLWKWDTFIRKDGKPALRAANQTVHGEIPVTGACKHRSTDVVDMWEAEVEQRRAGEKGVDELLRGIKGSFVTREWEPQQENTAACQLRFTVWLQIHSPGSWLGKPQLDDFLYSILLLLCQLSQKQTFKVSGPSVSLQSSAF